MTTRRFLATLTVLLLGGAPLSTSSAHANPAPVRPTFIAPHQALDHVGDSPYPPPQATDASFVADQGTVTCSPDSAQRFAQSTTFEIVRAYSLGDRPPSALCGRTSL
jgi:hypothetical protein